MKSLSRHHVNKKGSAKKFRHDVGHTKALNMKAPSPMRGGFRL